MEPSTQRSWACSEGSSLVQSCVRLCAWEDSLQQRGTQSSSSRLPSAVSPSASVRSRDVSSPLGKAALRNKPLPSELLVRMKDCGWTQKNAGSAIWVQQARQLAAARSAAPAATGCRAIHERLQLLEVLEQQAVPQGVEALRTALKLRCGSLERAFQCLDVSGRSGRGSLSLLEFVGATTLLGLDVTSLCGMDEASALAAMDSDSDGRLSLLDLLGAPTEAVNGPRTGASGQPCSDGGDASGSASDSATAGISERWVLVARFAALSAWFATPLLQRRRWRPNAGEATAALSFDRPETPGGGCGGMAVVTATAQGATGRASGHEAVARQQVPDPVRQSWAPNELDMEELEATWKTEFAKNHSMQQHDEQLLNKSDFFRILVDLPPQSICGNPDAQQLTRTKLAEIFDEVMTHQAKKLTQNGSVLSKGLTFESFGLALFKACQSMGLHFRHLVDDAVEAQERAVASNG